MNPIPKYRYVEEQQGGNLPIQIIEGKYEGFILRYDKLILEEKDDEMYFNYDYEILNNPNNIEMDEELKKTLSSIIFSIVEEQIGISADDLNLLKEGKSEEHRESDTSKSNIQ